VELRCLGDDVVIREWARLVRPENIWIGSHTWIDDFVLLAGGRGENITRLGDYVHIGAFSSILGSPGSTLEDFVCLAPGCRLFSTSEDYLGRGLIGSCIPEEYRRFDSAPIVLRRFVAIGTNSVIMPGVTIGEGASVGACSFVVGDIEPWTVNAGVPTRVLGQRRRSDILRYAEEISKQGVAA